MKVVVATPLYPPDIAEPAPYVKELARRLSKEPESSKTGGQSQTKLVIVTYGSLPEKIDGVDIITVNKNQPLLVRLLMYTFTLLKAVREADVIYMQNGASVELPTVIASYLTMEPLVVHMSDQRAHEHARQSTFYRAIEHLATSRAHTIITDMPLTKPEVLPFKTTPPHELEAYEASWDTHIRTLKDTFAHV